MNLEKILEEILGKKDKDRDDIGSVSCRIENQKQYIATKLPKTFYLNIVNLAIIEEYQIYALTCRLLDAKKDGKTHKELLELFIEEAIGCLKRNIKQLAEDIADFQKEKSEDK